MKKNSLMRILSILMVMALCLGACSSNTSSDSSQQSSSSAGSSSDDSSSSAGSLQEDTQNTDSTAAQDTEADSTGTEGADAAGSQESSAVNANAFTEKPDTDRYIKLALNVYYNDAATSYYSNECGQALYITEEGQYELTFDCASDLSAEAAAQGVSSLTNLTAIYFTDVENLNGEGKSPLKSCSIMYDKVVVDGTELTVTLDAPKSAFKSNGVFDTNDPINSWDGSYVAEVEAVDHVANFTTVANPKSITVTFTLSDMVWEDSDSSETESAADTETAVSAGTNNSVYSNMDFTDMDALTLSAYMGNGINLGNTFEATTAGKNASVATYESAWGQPTTTRAMIQGYKDAGFDTLRIPVAWTNTMDFENGDFEINADYLERVATVVQYALDAEMFVIVNDHWDHGWWAAFGSNNSEDVELAWKVYTSMWTQVAEYFKDYSDMLIFESANEELGNGLNNNSNWASSGYLSKDETYSVSNAINQKFVDIVRSTGGNNTDRFLLIAGINTNIADTLDSRFVMPTDTASGKLFVSVHYYDPSNYCLSGDSGNFSKWGIKSEYEYMSAKLASLTKFTDAGYGVIIGESGALAVYQDGIPYTQPNTVEWESYFMDNCAIYNYVGCFWDTNGTYNKAACSMRDSEVAEVFASRSYEQECLAGDGYLDTVKARMEAQYEAAPEMWDGVETYEAGTPVAWIMWNGGAGTYSVGDTFNPADNTAGITANNVIVDGAGEYEVSLDFAGGNSGLTFAALAIADGELLYPNCVILIEEISYDGNPVTLTATPYTSSDDGKCTRVNLINEWVSEIPKDARTMGNLVGASPVILDKTQITDIHNITIKFRLIVRG